MPDALSHHLDNIQQPRRSSMGCVLILEEHSIGPDRPEALVTLPALEETTPNQRHSLALPVRSGLKPVKSWLLISVDR